jgi:hypothetical protein
MRERDGVPMVDVDAEQDVNNDPRATQEQMRREQEVPPVEDNRPIDAAQDTPGSGEAGSSPTS